MAVLEALVMQRYWHQRPISREGFSQSGIGERLGGEASEVLGEMKFATVFQPVDHVQSALVADHGRAGEFEEKLEFAAIRAIEPAIDLSFKRLAAALAKRLRQPGQIRITGIAQGATFGQSIAAHHAQWRIEKVERAREPFPPPAGFTPRCRRRHGGRW
jgi:hypothetical protein